MRMQSCNLTYHHKSLTNPWGGGGGTSAGTLVNFDSFSEIQVFLIGRPINNQDQSGASLPLHADRRNKGKCST